MSTLSSQPNAQATQLYPPSQRRLPTQTSQPPVPTSSHQYMNPPSSLPTAQHPPSGSNPPPAAIEPFTKHPSYTTWLLNLRSQDPANHIPTLQTLFQASLVEKRAYTLLNDEFVQCLGLYFPSNINPTTASLAASIVGNCLYDMHTFGYNYSSSGKGMIEKLSPALSTYVFTLVSTDRPAPVRAQGWRIFWNLAIRNKPLREKPISDALLDLMKADCVALEPQVQIAVLGVIWAFAEDRNTPFARRFVDAKGLDSLVKVIHHDSPYSTEVYYLCFASMYSVLFGLGSHQLVRNAFILPDNGAKVTTLLKVFSRPECFHSNSVASKACDVLTILIFSHSPLQPLCIKENIHLVVKKFIHRCLVQSSTTSIATSRLPHYINTFIAFSYANPSLSEPSSKFVEECTPIWKQCITLMQTAPPGGTMLVPVALYLSVLAFKNMFFYSFLVKYGILPSLCAYISLPLLKERHNQDPTQVKRKLEYGCTIISHLCSSNQAAQQYVREKYLPALLPYLSEEIHACSVMKVIYSCCDQNPDIQRYVMTSDNGKYFQTLYKYFASQNGAFSLSAAACLSCCLRSNREEFANFITKCKSVPEFSTAWRRIMDFTKKFMPSLTTSGPNSNGASVPVSNHSMNANANNRQNPSRAPQASTLLPGSSSTTSSQNSQYQNTTSSAQYPSQSNFDLNPNMLPQYDQNTQNGAFDPNASASSGDFDAMFKLLDQLPDLP